MPVTKQGSIDKQISTGQKDPAPEPGQAMSAIENLLIQTCITCYIVKDNCAQSDMPNGSAQQLQQKGS